VRKRIIDRGPSIPAEWRKTDLETMNIPEKTQRRWGETPWRRAEGLPRGLKTAHCDVAIIGGGLTGVSTAYHLAKRGIRSTIFEAARVGDGASGRTGGIVLEGTAAGVLEEVDSCITELEALVARERIDCDLSLPGCWEIEHRASVNDRMLPWNDRGRPVCIARMVKGGIVQPAALVGGIARAAVLRGAVILEGCAVQRIAIKPHPAIESDGETIHPEYIVLALNAWTRALLPNAPGVESSLTFACATEPLPSSTLRVIGLDANMPFYTTDGPYLWGRTIADGRVIFGSQLVFGTPAELEAIDVSTDESGAALEALQKRVRRLHPQLHEVKFSASWAGPIAFRDNGVPLLGQHPSSSRVLVAGAYSGHGVALSVRMGQLLACAVAEGAPLPDWGAFASY
jgi:gamma-glutamylputrescine oxidase